MHSLISPDNNTSYASSYMSKGFGQDCSRPLHFKRLILSSIRVILLVIIMKKLSARQEKFIAEYLLTGNATQAAISAGYSKNSARQIGQKLLTKVDILACIQRKISEMNEEKICAAEELMAYLSAVVRGEDTEPFTTLNGKTYNLKPKISDKIHAAELLLKIHGKFREQVEITQTPAQAHLEMLEKLWNEK